MVDILIKPIVTEKMTDLGEKLNRYGFYVRKKANKNQIKNAVEAMYDVKVDAVNTMISQGKKKSRFTRTGVVAGKTTGYKKAIVTLSEGQEIDFYSNI